MFINKMPSKAIPRITSSELIRSDAFIGFRETAVSEKV
jgi:hypothetical protein